jgi:ribosomal 30S subunit maturation factor RimM
MTQNGQQDAAFYTMNQGSEVVWDGDENGRWYVLRNGEMRIHYTPDLTDTDNVVIVRYTDQLEKIGVLTDADLERFTDLGEEQFLWVDNPWFEVVDDKNPEYGEVYHLLDEAVERAIHLSQRNGEED